MAPVKNKPVKTTKRRGKITQVRSGIGLSALDPLNNRAIKHDNESGSLIPGSQSSPPTESFITSRTARVLLAGAGFLADAYDLFVINLVLRLLRDEYPQYAQSGEIHALEGSVASAALVGSIIGQLVAGSLADVFGRKRLFVLTAALISIGSFGSACSIDTPSLTIYGQIALWRFFLGAGVGGEYPLAATVTCESSSARKRGSLMAAVFSMQGAGSLLSGIVVYICLATGFTTGFAWRFALAFGSLPVLLAFPWRLMMHETESFQKLKTVRQVSKVAANSACGSNKLIQGSNGNGSSGSNGYFQHPHDGHCHHHHQHQIDSELEVEMATMLRGGPSMDTPSPVSDVKTTTSAGTDGSGLLKSKSQAYYQLTDLAGSGDSTNNNTNNAVSPIKPIGPLDGPYPSTSYSQQQQQVAASPAPFFPSYYQANPPGQQQQARERTLSDDYGHHMYISSRNNSNTHFERSYLLNNNNNTNNSMNGGMNTGSGSGMTTNPSASPSTTSTITNSAMMSGTKLGRWLEMNVCHNNNHHTETTPLKGGNIGMNRDQQQQHVIQHNPGQHPFVRLHHPQPPPPPYPPQQQGQQWQQQSQQQQQQSLIAAAGYGSALNNSAHGHYDNNNNNNIPAVCPPDIAVSETNSSRMAELMHAFKYYKYHIIGTAMSWFLLDIVFYGNGLFNHEVTAMVLSSSATSNMIPEEERNSPIATTALDDAFSSILLSLVSIPGYLLSVAYIEQVGRKNIQFFGFMIMSLLYFTCAYGYDYLLGVHSAEFAGKYWFLVIYSLTFLFSNFGPNTTTFVIPGEIYPAEVRATCHGLSAACGKLGAATGAYVFPMLLSSMQTSSSSNNNDGLPVVMYWCSVVAMLGAVVTYFFTPRYDGILLECKEQIENDKNDLTVSRGASTASLSDLNHPRKTSSSGGGEDDLLIDQSYHLQDARQDAEMDEETWLLNHSSYIPLEHRCLRPNVEDLRLLVEENDQYYNSYHCMGGYQSVFDEDNGGVFYERKKRKDGYEVLEVIQSTDNYAMDDL